MIQTLRKQRAWTQEQLAKASGLSLRTIQRLESGNKASQESLLALAATFNINVALLEQNIVIIDKDAPQWQKAPWLVRLIFWGSNTIRFKRQDAVYFEWLLLALSIASLMVSFSINDPSKSLVTSYCGYLFALCAYYMSVKVRLGDKYHIW